MKFRILRGNHAEGVYPDGHPWAGRSIVYEIGEIVDSKTNLSRFNASGPLGPRFQRIYDSTPATDKIQQGIEVARRLEDAAVDDDGNGPHGARPLPSDGLEELSLSDLRKLAKEEGVTVASNATKEEIIRMIRGVQTVA